MARTIADLRRTPSWSARNAPLAAADYAEFDGVLQIADSRPMPHGSLLLSAARKRGGESPPFCTLRGGATVVQMRWRKTGSVFSRLESFRKCWALLESAQKIAIDVQVPAAAQTMTFAALVAAAAMPGVSRKPPKIVFAGCDRKTANVAAAMAEANILSRALCRMPPNELTTGVFAKLAKRFAAESKLAAKVFDSAQLQKMGAGAIVAVGRAAENPPCIVRIRYEGAKKSPHIVFVGKGVCYDTGGVNLKPARHMRGMKKDMAGAAVALSAVLSAAALRLPLRVDAYLALAENAAGPLAYRPDDAVTSLSGKRIEVVHSDAEGRMILADALTLATRENEKADLFVSLATLTGTMHIALGERMSGVFADDPARLKSAISAAAASGERLCAFPLADDYKESLKSDVADIKQCAEEGEADHILAALFLREFMHKNPPWLHLDLSSASCKGGLGAAPGPETGFGAAWAAELLKQAAM